MTIFGRFLHIFHPQRKRTKISLPKNAYFIRNYLFYSCYSHFFSAQGGRVNPIA